MRRRVLGTTLIAAILIGGYAHAIHLGATEDGKLLPWARKMEHPLDQPVVAACKDGSFLMNLGPTGIRAMITKEQPKAFTVKFVFQDAKSPAKGLVKPGDLIIGANGKQFVDEHKFHRKQGGRGWPGPPFELAHALEDSQGSDGKLTLIVLEGGSPNKRKNVTLQLEPKGRFANTWPWNCPRSDKLRKQLVDHMLAHPMKRVHGATQRILALYASGDKRAEPLFKEYGQKLAKSRNDYHAGGMCTWGWGYQGIFLGEYYNIYKDNAVKPAIEALNQCYELGMTYTSGGFSHRPFPAIEKRVAEGGPKGYGAMAGPGGLSMVAGAVCQAAGLPISQRAYDRTHQAYLGGPGQTEHGTLAYGFGGGWSSVLIRLKNPASPCRSKEGVGYQCPTGMKNIGDFVVEKWSQGKDGKWDKTLVPPTGEYSWLKSEADSLLVYETGRYAQPGDNQRLVIRPKILPEPSGPYNNNRKGGGHNAPVGMGVAAHMIGSKVYPSWKYLGEHMAIGCASSPHTLWDGHASGEMHAFWGAIGAFFAPEKDLRKFLDYTKTWIILSESHDGQGLIDQPFGCQRNATCSINLDRTAYSHVALLILSIPNRNLLITGADFAKPAGPTTAKAHSYSGSSYSGSSSSASVPAPTPVISRPSLRDPRDLSADGHKALEKVIQTSLAALSDKGLLKKEAIRMSFTSKPVYVVAAESSGTITFQLADSTQTARVRWKSLSTKDVATVAVLLAKMRPESGDLQAVAGVCLESIGQVEAADEYFDKAGSSSKRKLEKLFN